MSTTQLDQTNTLEVYIRDPEKIYFQGKVIAISSLNEKGPFDILAEHENFITIIKDTLTLQMPDNTTKNVPLNKGVLKALRNKVYIFLELESLLGTKT